MVQGSHLKSSNTKSCGCLHIKHGHNCRNKRSKTYGTWRGMIKRCTNPNYNEYKYYGGRGIKVCEAWMKFEGFLQDMGERPPNLTLDRIDNDGNYCKENCRWHTWKEQNRNRRDNILITINGITKTLPELCEIYNLEYNKVYRYIRCGRTPEEAFGLNQEGDKMKFKTLSGKIISVQLRKKTLCRDVSNRSKGQINLGNLLKAIYGPVEIFEEFIIPDSKLSLDFFLPKRKLALEFQGKQHYTINNFFHKNKQDFINQQKRDLRKMEWCQINGITLVEINNDKISLVELKGLIIEQIRQQSNC